MNKFTAKYADQIQGVLTGFDRLVFRGSLRKISYVFGMKGYLWANQVLLKDFGAHVQQISERVKEASLQCVLDAGRVVRYLQSSQDDKEKIARAIAREQKITQGVVCALTCVEPCWGYDLHRNRETKELDLVQRSRKCLYVYQYWQHPELGWWNARIQTWFPFSIQICMNGREWLACQMDRSGVGYRKEDNCFPWIEDWEQAQKLMDTQLQAKWPELLDGIGGQLNPIHDKIFQHFPVGYYWSTYQSEWATDVSFRKAEDLRRLTPLWMHHGVISLSSSDVLRFLGKKPTASGEINGHVTAEVTSSLKRRQQGARIKHGYNGNSVKLYDKAYTPQGSLVRTELTMQNPEDFKVFRSREGDPEQRLAWLRMRRGIADLYCRAQVSQKANERYLDALASVDDSITLQELISRIQKPVTSQGKRMRALHPFDDQDRLLLKAIGRGDFVMSGFRNKDLQPLLYTAVAKSEKESRRRSAAISRKLRLLRAHHLIRKGPGTYRYQVTEAGRQIITAVLAASNATVNTFIPKAA